MVADLEDFDSGNRFGEDPKEEVMRRCLLTATTSRVCASWILPTRFLQLCFVGREYLQRFGASQAVYEIEVDRADASKDVPCLSKEGNVMTNPS